MGNELSHGPFQIRVHHPVKDENRGRKLADGCPWPVYDVADYDDGRLPGEWERGGANKSSFFMSVERDRELWFDFRWLTGLDRYVAVMVSIQGMNSVTGMPLSDGLIQLEQYRTGCPKHNVPFITGHFCRDCGYEWPHQNYIHNANHGAASQFWTDGWRQPNGKIAQFVMSQESEGFGIAEQVLGESRAFGMGFAIFLSKHPKSYDGIRRPSSGHPSGEFLLGGPSSLKQGASDSYSATRGGSSLGELLIADRSSDAPSRAEVSAGRFVDQQVCSDRNDLSFWQTKPSGFIILTPTLNASWVHEITRNGPTVRTPAKFGPLAGLRTVGE